MKKEQINQAIEMLIRGEELQTVMDFFEGIIKTV